MSLETKQPSVFHIPEEFAHHSFTGDQYGVQNVSWDLQCRWKRNNPRFFIFRRSLPIIPLRGTSTECKMYHGIYNVVGNETTLGFSYSGGVCPSFLYGGPVRSAKCIMGSTMSLETKQPSVFHIPEEFAHHSFT